MSEMKPKLTGLCLNRTGNFLVFGVAAIYNIFFCGESLRVQTGGLGGSAQSEFMAFQLRSNTHCSCMASNWRYLAFFSKETLLSSSSAKRHNFKHCQCR